MVHSEIHNINHIIIKALARYVDLASKRYLLHHVHSWIHSNVFSQVGKRYKHMFNRRHKDTSQMDVQKYFNIYSSISLPRRRFMAHRAAFRIGLNGPLRLLLVISVSNKVSIAGQSLPTDNRVYSVWKSS